MALSWIYALYGNVPIVAALFFGLKAAVLAIVLAGGASASAAARLKNRAMVALAAPGLRRDLLLRRAVPADRARRRADRLCRRARRLGRFPVGGGHGLPARARRRREPARRRTARARAADRRRRALRVGGGLAGALAGPGRRARSPRWARATPSARSRVFFSKMAVVTFGGAYAVLAYVAQQAVENYHWLRPGEMLDGLGMAETTPGPLIMVLQFVGFMAAYREPGASAAAAGRHARRPAGDLGDVHALLPVDLPRRALHRGAARQQGAQRRARRRSPRRWSA